MTGKTHLTGGLALGLGLALISKNPALSLTQPLPVWGIGIPAFFLALPTLALGSLLPDIDEPGSLISNAPRVISGHIRRGMGRRGIEGVIATFLCLPLLIINPVTRLLSHLVRRISSGHRATTHRPAAVLLISILFAALGNTFSYPALGLWLFIGLASHLALDMMTLSGLTLLFPFSPRPCWLLPRPLRVRTGSGVDVGLTVLFSLLATGLMYPALYPAPGGAL